MAFQRQKRKEIRREILRHVLLFLMLLFLSGCSGFSPSSTSPDLILVNYTKFSNRIWVSELDGEYFHTALIRVTFELGPDGTTQLSSEQEPLGTHVSVSYGCDPGVVAVSSDAAFRKKAEVYLQSGDLEWRRDAEVLIDGEKWPIFHSGACPKFSAPSDPVLVAYPKAGSSFEVRGMKDSGPRAMRWVIPEIFSPYVLVRYQAGEMIPTPMRADTIFLRPQEKKLSIIYRATFPLEPAVRKAEFRLIQTGDKNSLREVEYLDSCPLPTLPPEPCSRPDVKPAAAFFGR